MRPVLKPGLLPVWRDRDTLQIGIDPRRAVALTGMADAAWVISLLDGSRDRAQVIAAARDRGMPAELADRVLTLLAAGGALDDFPAGTYRVLSRQLRARLAPELAATSLAHGYGDGGARALARRRAAHVRVLGGGRLAPAITAILAASGIGQVDGGDARPAEPAPTEPAPAPAAQAPAAPALPARAGRAQAGRGQPGQAPVTRPDLVVLVGITDPELAARLMRERIPHLAASASEAIGVVGPLVTPGRSAWL